MSDFTTADFKKLHQQYEKLQDKNKKTKEDIREIAKLIEELDDCASFLAEKKRYTPALNWLCYRHKCIRKNCNCGRNTDTKDEGSKPEIFQDLKNLTSAKTKDDDGSSHEDDYFEGSNEKFNRTKSKKPFVAETIPTKRQVDKALKQFDAFIGMDHVKKQVEVMIKDMVVRMRREKIGLPTEKSSRHMVLMGNPGTGKTETARTIASILHELGLTEENKFIETDRAGLVGYYIGHTEYYVEKAIQESLGGVLFIDEAYALLRAGSSVDFGHELIATLIKGMEDHRENLIVIAAGYSDEMEWFLKTNPGLESRFSHKIHFPDYSNNELVEIFQKFCDKQKFSLCDDSKEILKHGLESMPFKIKNKFGNGRGVRNLFEKTISNQSARVYDKNLKSRKKLTQILPQDIPFRAVKREGNVYYVTK